MVQTLNWKVLIFLCWQKYFSQSHVMLVCTIRLILPPRNKIHIFVLLYNILYLHVRIKLNWPHNTTPQSMHMSSFHQQDAKYLRCIISRNLFNSEGVSTSNWRKKHDLYRKKITWASPCDYTVISANKFKKLFTD